MAERERKRRGVSYFESAQTFDGVAICVKRYPTEIVGGPVFVLVHGIGVSSRYFHPVSAELAKHGEVYLIDLPGYGAAPDPKTNASISDHAGVVGAFLERAQLDKPVLVGHSMGTQVVSQLAVDHPDVTDRVVLIAPTIYPPERKLWRQALHLGHDILLERPWVNAIVFTDYMFRCGVPYFLRQSKPLLADRIEDRMPRVRAKTLVMRGDRDPIVPRAWAQRVADLAVDGRYAEVEGPHIIMWSDAKRAAELIVEHSR
ncbi:MAG: putative hydrolase [Microbacteriaceae bacterium]|jgi:pimeloyl-ACP methyl ester carboxylesterase|nr:putative hydrolase [Microbacteriaceae bacterium]